MIDNEKIKKAVEVIKESGFRTSYTDVLLTLAEHYLKTSEDLPEKKKQKIHGHEKCPECMKYGYNHAHDQFTALIAKHYVRKVEVAELVEALENAGENIKSFMAERGQSFEDGWRCGALDKIESALSKFNKGE